MQIYAHRGSSGTHQENTLPAFAEAARVKADGIELDVQMSKDGQLVIIHDDTVDRTTNGKGKVSEKTFAELRKLNAGSWFDPSYTSTKVPTLKEVLDLLVARNYRGILDIELKTDQEEYPGIEQKVSELLKSANWPFTYFYTSFNDHSLDRIHQLEPEIAISYIMGNSDKKVALAKEVDFVEGIHPDMTWVLNHQEQIQEYPKKIRPWTIDDKEQMRLCIALNLDGFFTNYPEIAMNVKRNG